MNLKIIAGIVLVAPGAILLLLTTMRILYDAARGDIDARRVLGVLLVFASAAIGMIMLGDYI